MVQTTPMNGVPRGINIVASNGGSNITTGVIGYFIVPFDGTISSASLISDQAAGSCVIDVWKTSYAGAPPTVANTITASALPTLSAAQKYQDNTLTGWTKNVSAGDVLGFNINSISGSIKQLSISLGITAS